MKNCQKAIQENTASNLNNFRLMCYSYLAVVSQLNTTFIGDN